MLISDEKQQPAATDGRVRRSERSKAAIVHALFELIGEGVTAPTADEVAERASIGIRTVFRQFKDMDTLYGALVSRMRKDLRRWFPELKRMDAATMHALELVTSFEAWDRLRVDQRLGKQRAAEVMKQAMSALLG